jgi:hypothetical protein
MPGDRRDRSCRETAVISHDRSSDEAFGLREKSATVAVLEIEQLVKRPVEMVSEPGHLRV